MLLKYGLGPRGRSICGGDREDMAGPGCNFQVMLGNMCNRNECSLLLASEESKSASRLLPSHSLTDSSCLCLPKLLPYYFLAAVFPPTPRNVSVHGELFLFFSYINAMK